MMVMIMKKDFDIKDPDFQLSYCGSPCHNEEEAAEIVYNRRMWGCDFDVTYVNNGTNYTEIDRITGEIHTVYYVRIVEGERI